jgi:hypothetical protein
MARSVSSEQFVALKGRNSMLEYDDVISFVSAVPEGDVWSNIMFDRTKDTISDGKSKLLSS